MNGAESMLQTLMNNGVEVCFTNPGTSEMHMVAAIGESDGMRSILCLFEGVCSGAADGYARMLAKPACTLLHLGPGLSNASANLHNARKANSSVINLIGDHATYHKKLDAPLNSDVIGLSGPISHWVRSVTNAASLPSDAADAVLAANVKPGQIATLIVPADSAWNESVDPVTARDMPSAPLVGDESVKTAAELLTNGKTTILLMSNLALSERCLDLADQISQATGAKIFCDTFVTRLPRGEGRCSVARLGYFAEQATEQIKDAEQLIMVYTKAPVSFFAYPGKVSEFSPQNSTQHTLAQVSEDAEDALQKLVTELNAGNHHPRKRSLQKPGLGSGELSSKNLALTFAELLPVDSVVVDEGGTAGALCFPISENAQPHDWLTITGGSIGYGLPVAVGAAVACPDRKIICLQGDGGAMYTIQALWTMARENLDVCIVILANRKYQILQVELARVGAQSMNKKTLDMMDLTNPNLDFVKMSESMGVKAARAHNADEFNKLFAQGMEEPGPMLIEALLT
ncbi:MAG: acetolactate synthase large subunit [Pseudomonadales bacterium]|jgi:acetolactate synthase-1/2/3 large subunit|nr:acetolactate synthase large subunit [Pseudomonadales bacterium]MDP7595213.1 acetolactate synthase large subunit [Pseudomonadales bacterium]HJN53129.1 acetolactate synthase large subunit [Pseudomonadales bacterium]|tara:strand:+ start:3565 stop:5112 length:1548 start_codon:yes stop_codon:yes gene_type:complete